MSDKLEIEIGSQDAVIASQNLDKLTASVEAFSASLASASKSTSALKELKQAFASLGGNSSALDELSKAVKNLSASASSLKSAFEESFRTLNATIKREMEYLRATISTNGIAVGKDFAKAVDSSTPEAVAAVTRQGKAINTAAKMVAAAMNNAQGAYQKYNPNTGLAGALVDPSADKIKAELKAQADSLIAAAKEQVTRIRQQVTAATNTASGAYQKYNPNTGLAGAVVNTVPSQPPTNLGKWSQALKSFTVDANAAHSASRGLSSGFGLLWLTWGSMTPLLAGAAISNGFMQIVKSGADVQQSLTQIMVLSGATATETDNLQKRLLELSRTGPYGPREIAAAMKDLSLAGLDAKQVYQAMPEVMNLAIAGTTSLEAASKALITVGTAFNISAAGYGYIADVIAKTASVSVSSIEDMTEAYKTAAVINKLYGVSLEDTSIGLALLSNASIKGTSAGTSLRNMYADLAERTPKLARMFKELGVQAIDPTTGKMREQARVFEELLLALSKRTPEEVTKLISQGLSEQGQKAFMAILDGMRQKVAETGNDITTIYSDIATKIHDSAGFAAVSAAQLSLTPLNQMKSVAASLESALVESFGLIQPYLVTIAQQLKEVFQSDGFKQGIADFALKIAKLIEVFVKNISTIADLVAGYFAFKGVLVGVGAVLTMITTYATAAEAGMVGLGLALQVITKSNPALAIISGLISAGAAAWFLYAKHTGSASESVNNYVGSSAKDLLKALSEEYNRLDNIRKAREKNIDLQEQEARIALAKARAEKSADVAKAETALADAQKPTLPPSVGLLGGMDRFVLGPVIDKLDKSRADKIAAAKANLEQAKTKANLDLEAIEVFIREIAEIRKKEAALAQQGAQKSALGDPNGKKYDLNAGKGITKTFDDGRLKAIQEQDASNLARLKKEADKEQAILKDKNKNLLIADGEYMAQSIALDAKFGMEQIAVLEKSLSEQNALREKKRKEAVALLAKQKPGTNDYERLSAEIKKYYKEEETAAKVTSDKIKEIQDDMFSKQEERLRDIQGITNKFQKDETAYWSKTDNVDTKADKLQAIAEQYKYMNTSIFSAAAAEKAYAEAVVESDASYADRANKMREEIRLREESIKALQDQIALLSVMTPDAVNQAQMEQLSTVLQAYTADTDKLKKILEDGLANSAKRGAEKGADAYKKVMDAKADTLVTGVSDAVSAAITDGAEVGKKSLWKLLQDELIKKPLKVFVNIVVNSILGANGVLGSAVSSGVSSAAGSLIGGAANAMGLANLAGMTTTTGLAYANATSAMGMYGGDSLTALLATNEAFGTAATTTAAAAGSLASTVGAVLPWVGGALAIGGLLKGIFGGGSPRYYLKTSSQDNAGGEGFEDGVKVQSAYGYIGLGDKWTKNIDANSMKPALDAVAQLDNAIAAALSPQQNAKIAAALDGYVSEKNDSVETYVKGRLAIITQTLGGALNELAGMFSGTTDELATYIVRLANAQKLLPAIADLGTFGNVSAAMLQNSQSALKLADALQTTFGSTDNATTALQNYYNNFYTEQERTAAATQKVSDAFAQLGLAMPSTRESFRDLVQAQDVNTDAGRSMYASLIALSGAFANVIPATEAATAAVDKQLSDLKAKSTELENQLAVLRGTKTQAEIDTAGMSDAAKAVYEYNASLQSQIDAINAASKAAEADAQKRLDLENQLLDLQGNTAAIRARELAGLSATNQALQQQIWALQDAKAAQDAYNQAVQDAQQAYQTAQSNLASAQSAVKAVQDKATNAYISAQDRVATASQNLANAQQQVAQNAYDAAVALQKLGQNLKDWVQQQLTQSSDPQTAARLAASQYRTTLAAAKTGDQNAIQQLTQDAGAYLTAAQTVTASKEYAILRASILGEVQRLGNSIIAKPLPPEPAKQDPVVAAQQELASATAEMTSAMTMALSIGAPLTKAVDDLVSEYQAALAAQQEAQAKVDATAAALAAITKNTGDTVTGISGLDVSIDEAKLKAQLAITAAVDVVMASALPDEIKQLALGVTGAVQKTVAVTLQTASIDSTAKKVVVDAAGTYSANIASIIGASVPDSIKTLLMAGAATSNMAVTLGATMSNALTDDQRAVLNATAGTVQRILSQSVVSGALTDDQRTMLYKAAGTINSTLALLASGGTLTADQRAILQQQTATAQKTVAMYVNDGSLTADQKKYLNLSSLTNATVSLNGSVTFDPSAALNTLVNQMWYAIVDASGAITSNLAYTNTYLSYIRTAVETTNVRGFAAGGYFDFANQYLYAIKNYAAITNSRGFANGGAFISGVQAFASGGSFTNSIVSTPTYFNMGLMGEAGPEAIMPLARTADGKLGVRSTNPSATIAVPIPVATNNQENDIRIQELLARIEQATRDQKEEVVILRKRIDQQLIEQTRMSQDIARMRINGVMVYTDPAEPIQTVSV